MCANQAHALPTHEHPATDQRVIYSSEELLGRGRREVWIVHGAEMYCLRHTSTGKLYLTK